MTDEQTSQKADDLLNRAQIVREFGRDKRTVERRLIGVEPVKIEKRGQLLIRYWRRADIETAMMQRTSADELAHQLERLHKAKADRLEIERQIRSGEVLEIDAIFEEIAKRFADARTIILSAPSRLAPEIAVINATRIGEDALRARTALIATVIAQAIAIISAPLSFQRHDA